MNRILCSGTGFSEKIAIQKAYAIGIRGYIEKPYNIQKMATAVRKVLEGE